MATKIKEAELYVHWRGHFNEPRDVAVCLIRLSNHTLKHLREQSGIEKYSTVSSIVKRVKNEMKAEKSPRVNGRLDPCTNRALWQKKGK